MHVVVFGAFDGLHPGHLDFFRQARQHGDRLTVVVGHSETIFHRKGRYPEHGDRERLDAVESAPYVDDALLGNPSAAVSEQLAIISGLDPDVICLGYDQKPDEKQLKKLLDEHEIYNIKVVTLAPYKPEMYKSSKLRE